MILLSLVPIGYCWKVEDVEMTDFIYQAIASVHDPRSDRCDQDNPVFDLVNMERERAIRFAMRWARAGYFGSVYHQRTGECVAEYSPS